MTEAVIPTTLTRNTATYIAVGACGSVGLLLVVAGVLVLSVVLVRKTKLQLRQGMRVGGSNY